MVRVIPGVVVRGGRVVGAKTEKKNTRFICFVLRISKILNH